jgi:hypothetical protein
MVMKFLHIGWCKEDKHDKVWGIIFLAEGTGSGWPIHFNKYLTFWGRRGAKLQTKIVSCSSYDASEMFAKKRKRGYNEVDKNHLDKVYPEFQSDLEKTAIWESLKL